MSSDIEDGIDYEKTKSIILDYVTLFRDSKWIIGITVVVGIIISLSVLGIFYYLPDVYEGDQQAVAFTVLIATLVFTVSIWLPVSNGGMILRFILKGRQKQRELLNVHYQFIRRSYLINFEVVSADGKTRLERIFNHLSIVFPEIKRVNDRLIKKNITIAKYSRRFRFSPLRDYDLVIGTIMGFYVVKIFDKEITMEDINDAVKTINRQQINYKIFGPKEIQRLIVLGKSYDKFFSTAEFTQTVRELKRRCKLDLILEEDEYGYATIWID